MNHNEIKEEKKAFTELKIGEVFTKEKSDKIMEWVKIYTEQQYRKGYNAGIERSLEVVTKEVKKQLLSRMMKYDSKDGYSEIHDNVIEKVYEDVEDIISSSQLKALIK